jgi:hypothetical protein
MYFIKVYKNYINTVSIVPHMRVYNCTNVLATFCRYCTPSQVTFNNFYHSSVQFVSFLYTSYFPTRIFFLSYECVCPRITVGVKGLPRVRERLSSCLNWAPPPPLRKPVCLPLLDPSGGETHRLVGRRGGPNSDDQNFGTLYGINPLRTKLSKG